MQSQLNYTRTRLLRRAAFDGVQTAGRSSFSSLPQKAQDQTQRAIQYDRNAPITFTYTFLARLRPTVSCRAQSPSCLRVCTRF